MAAPCIPGFFYDEDRKKYFKITNGSLTNNSSARYHNNSIQSKRRREPFVSSDTETLLSKTRKLNVADGIGPDLAKSALCKRWTRKALMSNLLFVNEGGNYNLLCGNARLSTLYNAGDLVDFLRLNPNKDIKPSTLTSKTNDANIRDHKAIFDDAIFRKIQEQNSDMICNWSRNVSLHHVIPNTPSEKQTTITIAALSMSKNEKSLSILRVFVNGVDMSGHLLHFIRECEKSAKGPAKNTLRHMFSTDHSHFDEIPYIRKTQRVHQDIDSVNKHLNLLNSNNLTPQEQLRSKQVLDCFLRKQNPLGNDALSYTFRYNPHATNQRVHIVAMTVTSNDMFFLSSESDLIRIGYNAKNNEILFDSFACIKLPIKGAREYSQIVSVESTVYVMIQRHLILVDRSGIRESAQHVPRSTVIPLREIGKRFHVVSTKTFVIAFASSIQLVQLDPTLKAGSSQFRKVSPDMVSYEKLALLYYSHGGGQCMKVIGHHLIVFQGDDTFKIINMRRTPALDNNSTLVKIACDLHDKHDYQVCEILPVSTTRNAIGILRRNKSKLHYCEISI